MPSVREVIDLCKGVGLEVQLNPARGGHTLYDIIDPSTGTILTGISGSAGKQGGDPNWYFNIRRLLRHAGFKIEFEQGGKRKATKNRANRQKSAIDLDALAKAQEQARAAGVHVPTLEDLDEHPEFFRRISAAGGTQAAKSYGANAQDEVINSMAPRVETPRFNATLQRLRTQLEKKEDELVERAKERFAAEGKKWTSPSPSGSARSEFVRIAIEEVAPARDLRAWPTLASGQQVLYAMLEKDKTASLWAINLIEATMDHIDGLKWGVIDESRKRTAIATSATIAPPPQVPTGGTIGPHDPSHKVEPNETTEDVAIALVEEYEESFRRIAEQASMVYTDVAWQQEADKPKVAESAVLDLKTNYDALLTEARRIRATTSENGDIRENYAKSLLDILQNYTEEKGNYLLDQILERLDKLAGIS